jgi:hypothetical protein
MKWGKDSTMTPAIAMKLFRNSVISGNILAMNSFTGTTTPNFFEYNFSNHIKQDTGFGLKLAATKFAQASVFPFSLGLTDFGKYDE